MMNFDFVYMLIIHWLADFAIQTDKQAKLKSTSIVQLLAHVSTYSLIWLIASYYYFASIDKCIIFAAVTFVTHFCTDYITSRVGKPYWENNDYHNGFVIVGFDQILHYFQLAVAVDIIK